MFYLDPAWLENIKLWIKSFGNPTDEKVRAKINNFITSRIGLIQHIVDCKRKINALKQQIKQLEEVSKNKDLNEHTFQ